MKAELGADHCAQAAGAEFAAGLFKFLHHFAGAEPAQVAALAFGGTGGKILGQGFKSRATFQLLQETFGQCFIFYQYMTCSVFHDGKYIYPP